MDESILQDSLMESASEDDVFFGPITCKELKIRERFEKHQNGILMPPIFDDCIQNKVYESKNEASVNTSLYDSFNVNASKCDSFDDSLNEEQPNLSPKEINAAQFLAEQAAYVSIRKCQDKQKLRANYLCDSLEDICSLVSSIELNSDEMENIANIIEKHGVCEDSLRNVYQENTNASSNEQYDEDSLAILEVEKTSFDDSLDDLNAPPCVDSLIIYRKSARDVDAIAESSSRMKNIFETSVDVIYENVGSDGRNSNADDSSSDNFHSSESHMSRDSLEKISSDLACEHVDALICMDLAPIAKDYANNLNISEQFCTGAVEDIVMITQKDTDFDHSGNTKPKSGSKSHDWKESLNSNALTLPFKTSESNCNDTISVDDSVYLSCDSSVSEKEKYINNVDLQQEPVLSKSLKKSFDTYVCSPSVKNNGLSETIYVKDSECVSTDSAQNVTVGTSEVDVKNNPLIYPETSCNDSCKVMNPTSNYNKTILIDDSVCESNNFTQQVNLKMFSTLAKDSNSKTISRNDNGREADIACCKFNETICIDDSVCESNISNTVPNHKMPLFHTKDLNSKVTSTHNLSKKVDSGNVKYGSKLNGTICIDNFVCEPNDSNQHKGQKMLFIKDKDSISKVLSPNDFREKIGNNVKGSESNFNETICIDDSVCLPSMSGLNENRPLSLVADKDLEKIGKDVEGNDNNFNGTICIDDSVCLPNMSVLNEKQSISLVVDKDLFLAPNNDESQSAVVNINLDALIKPEVKVKNELSIRPLFASPRSNNVSASPISVSDRKEFKTSIKDVSCHSNDTKTVEPCIVSKQKENEINLKLHIEVEIDKNRGVNVISVSSMGVDARETSGKNNLKAKVTGRDDFSKNSAFDDQIFPFDVVQKTFPLGELSVASCVNAKSHQCKWMNLVSPCNHGMQIKCELANAKLIQALDLHNTSCNASEIGHVQSRDSIVPLNLFSTEKWNNPLLRNESKENIPFNAINSKIQKQQVKNSPNRIKETIGMEVKRSGGKVNSATKIPIRKVDRTVSSEGISSKTKPLLFTEPFRHKLDTKDTSKKHHFCTVRNSISRVPKSAQKPTFKKFPNIQSPVAMYIGNTKVYTPLKTTYRFDGNLVPANMHPSYSTVLKPATVRSPQNPISTRIERKI